MYAFVGGARDKKTSRRAGELLRDKSNYQSTINYCRYYIEGGTMSDPSQRNSKDYYYFKI